MMWPFKKETETEPPNPGPRDGDRPVTMKLSVGHRDGELLGGQDYLLTAEKADEMIIKGYAEGELSRDYSPEEVNQFLAKRQAIVFGGNQ